jgi:hypothetical protein
MDDLKLLIIEDEAVQIQMYQDIIEQFNKKNDLQIDTEICDDFISGEKALNTPDYDAAIIDLKLSNSQELEGKKLVEKVYGKLRIPIVIYSGSIAQIDDITETAFLKKRLRTENLLDILNEIIVIYNTGITKLLRPSGDIDKKLTHIFWNQLVNDLDIWIEHNNPKTLLRYIFTHFQEHMEINMDGDFEEYHPAEIYISPPIKTNLHTGDLIRFEGEFFIILTPACDIVFNYKNDADGNKIASRKANHLVVAQAKEFNYKELCQNKKGELDKGKIKHFVTNTFYRYHYLPPFKGDNGFIIDFQEIKTIQFDDKIERIASISGAFTKDIISRFSLYYARQGQPTFFQQKIVDDLFARE